MDEPVVAPARRWGGGQAQCQAAIPQRVRSAHFLIANLFHPGFEHHLGCTLSPNMFPNPICPLSKFFIASFPRNGCLYELCVAGLDRLKLSYKQFFPSPFLQTEQAEIQFTELLTAIGSWPQVCPFSLFRIIVTVNLSGREGIRFSIPGAALLPGHAGPRREEKGRGLPAQVRHSPPEIPHQQVSSILLSSEPGKTLFLLLSQFKASSTLLQKNLTNK